MVVVAAAALVWAVVFLVALAYCQAVQFGASQPVLGSRKALENPTAWVADDDDSPQWKERENRKDSSFCRLQPPCSSWVVAVANLFACGSSAVAAADYCVVVLQFFLCCSVVSEES